MSSLPFVKVALAAPVCHRCQQAGKYYAYVNAYASVYVYMYMTIVCVYGYVYMYIVYRSIM